MPSCVTVPSSTAASNVRHTSSVSASVGSGECSTSESMRRVRRFSSDFDIDWRAWSASGARASYGTLFGSCPRSGVNLVCSQSSSRETPCSLARRASAAPTRSSR